MTLCGERNGFSLWAILLRPANIVRIFAHILLYLFLPLLPSFLFLASARVLAPSDQPAEVESCDKSSCVERQTATCPAGLVDDVLMVILNFSRSLDTPGRPGLQTPPHYCVASISTRFTKESTLYSINSIGACKIDNKYVAVSAKAGPLPNLIWHSLNLLTT